MSRALQRLNLLALSVLAAVLGCVLVAQTWPGAPQLAGVRGWGIQQADWPKTLQVYPSHPGDPVKLVRIIRDGKEVVPGTYRLPEIAGDHSNAHAVDDWLKDVSFVLRSQTPKTIISVGLSVVFPARRTDLECAQITGHKSAREPWCDAHPHYCDGGCPELIDKALYWGLIPAQAASALEARYRARGWPTPPYLDPESSKSALRYLYGTEVEAQLSLLGKDWLRLAPGQEIALSLAGRGDSLLTHTDPRKPFTNIVNGILFGDGIDEATGTEPCRNRLDSKTGCAFSEVSKFNIGLDIVYFEDGTIWGNYGYGFAVPSPDGIYTRVQADGSQGDLDAPPEPN